MSIPPGERRETTGKVNYPLHKCERPAYTWGAWENGLENERWETSTEGASNRVLRKSLVCGILPVVEMVKEVEDGND